MMPVKAIPDHRSDFVSNYSGALAGRTVRIKIGWLCAGRKGKAVGDALFVGGQWWVPLVWEGDEDPSFEKRASLEVYRPEAGRK